MADPQAVLEARRQLGQQLAAKRNMAGLSQQAVADQTTYSRSSIASIETGHQNVNRAFWETADAFLKAGGDLLRLYDAAENLRRSHQRRPVQALATHADREVVVLSPAPIDSIHEPSARPSALLLPSPSYERSILAMAADRARRFAFLISESTTPEAVAQLRDEVQRLASAYPQQSLPEILGDLAETQDAVFNLLERRQAPQQAIQLHFLASITSGLLAKASHDLGDAHAAMLQLRTATLCANQAEHNGLRAWLHGLQSLVSYWAGRYAESVRYAESGVQFAAQGKGTTSVWLPISAARSYAALGNSEKTLDAIRSAEETWGQVEPDELDELGGICTFNRPRTLYYAADALAWLPAETAKAVDYATRAVEAYADPNDPAWAFGDHAGARSDLAIARIAAGSIEGAEEALAPVLDLVPSQRINGVVGSVQHVHQAVARAGLSSDAYNFIERIESFTTTPLRALPR